MTGFWRTCGHPHRQPIRGRQLEQAATDRSSRVTRTDPATLLSLVKSLFGGSGGEDSGHTNQEPLELRARSYEVTRLFVVGPGPGRRIAGKPAEAAGWGGARPG